MAGCCAEECWEELQPLLWIYLQVLAERQEEQLEEEEEEVQSHSPVKSERAGQWTTCLFSSNTFQFSPTHCNPVNPVHSNNVQIQNSSNAVS